MPANRTFDFPVSTLLRDSKRLHAALVDTTTGPAIARRLSKKNPVAGQPDIVFAPLFDAQIQLVENGGIAQSGAFGEIGQMTQEQVDAFAEMERLLSGARRSARLAFPSNDARLAHPTAKAAKDEATLVARNRFLLEEFPPRGGASAGDKPVTTTPVQ